MRTVASVPKIYTYPPPKVSQPQFGPLQVNQPSKLERKERQESLIRYVGVRGGWVLAWLEFGRVLLSTSQTRVLL